MNKGEEIVLMVFKNAKDNDVEVNRENFKRILRGDNALESGLLPIEFKNGTIEYLKATVEQIGKAINGGTWT